jgi:deoxycytidine triphosphate deaminase
MAYSSEDFFANYRKTFVIAPFKPSQVTPLGYDLRLGFLVNADSESDLKRSADAIDSKNIFYIEPDQSVIAVTLERIFLSGKVLATVHARATLSLRGLMLSAVTVDPNFGQPKLDDESTPGSRLLFRLKNTSKHVVILTTEDDAIATLIVHEVQTETNRRPVNSGVSDLLNKMIEVDKAAIPVGSIAKIRDFVHRRSTRKQNGIEVLDKTEREFRQASEDMMHFRDLLRSRARPSH